jgi:hypothetical protein
MSLEEKPPEDLDQSSAQSTDNQETQVPSKATSEPANPYEPETHRSEADENGVVIAEPANVPATPTTPLKAFSSLSQPPIARNLENMAANGGAVGSFVLGLWCLAGSLVTNWSIINGFLGLLLGLWGLSSRKRRLAWIGITLCVVGIFMSMLQISELINTYMIDTQEEFGP